MYSIYLSLCFSLALLSLGQAQVACNLRSLYTRLLDDVSLSDAFCTEFRNHNANSKDFLYQFGTNCEAYRAEISMGCSLFGTTTTQFMPQMKPPAVVTVTETVTNSKSAGICTPSVKMVTVSLESQAQRQRQQPTDLSLIASSGRLSPLYAPPQVPIGMDKDRSIPDPVHAAQSSFLTTPTASPFSTMAPPASFFVPFSSVLTTTLSTVYQSSISSLATQAPTSTDRYVVPAPSPSLVDRHIFSPLGDLTIDETTSAVSGALTFPHDASSGADDAPSMTIVYLKDASPDTCVHMKGSWTPLYTKAVYECVAKTRAPDFDSRNYPNASTGLSLTAEDGSSSITNSRALGPQAEGDYEEASLSLFVTKDKTYTVEFWACGSGKTLVVGELSCTYYA
ncbi:uncharacterized protein PV06_04703 [Exophiala oligosperma]|uniref:Ubiquitin 3 binding protein But2 C-terminal domain-containing protein n=2 Tax=Chaetothyriales TaxID=34395 RepID=A0A0D2DKW4_9EURO|nr:uncharacterized protein PV06_04703 [Exophiala oligosperma]KAJ9631309.1 hypothetical protein H2204_008251 [Knufia peltigerae]KIW43618.1 hypothetical protein PV06_04703 [Exophiala oligosperma]